MICTCTYIRSLTALLDRRKTGFLGTFWKFARIGERKSPWIAAACIIMAISDLIYLILTHTHTYTLSFHPKCSLFHYFSRFLFHVFHCFTKSISQELKTNMIFIWLKWNKYIFYRYKIYKWWKEDNQIACKLMSKMIMNMFCVMIMMINPMIQNRVFFRVFQTPINNIENLFFFKVIS